MTLQKNFFVIFLILVSFIFAISKFYTFYLNYSDWQYADWLINYQAGFVRRGLIGEILFHIHQIFYIRLDILIFFFVSSLYLLFSIFLFKSLRYLENSNIDLLILFSPGFFLYPIMNSEVIGRKEILFLSIFSSLIFLEKKIRQNYILPLFLIIVAILSLSHSAFIFYAPFFLVLYILIKKNRNLNINPWEIFIISLSFFLLVFLIYISNGSQMHIEKICLSVREFVSNNCGLTDQISWLESSIDNYINAKSSDDLLKRYFLIYGFSLIAVFLFISIKILNSKYTLKFAVYQKFHPFFVMLILCLSTTPTFIIGLDWGRYIYIAYSTVFFLLIYCIKNKVLEFREIFFYKKINFNNKLIIVFIFFYSFFWTFPFYDAKNFKLTLNKPIKIIIQKINN
jgi:hypothetical protein